VLIDIASGPGGVYDWQVDGVNQLNRHWFYYRVGSTGPEYPIEHINGSPKINAVPNPFMARLDVSYTNSNYSVRTFYQLVGQSAGSGNAQLSESITVANASSSSLEFHFYQYSDFDLGGVSGNQTVQFYTNEINGQYYKVIQHLGSSSVFERVDSEAPPIGHVEAAEYDQTLASLTDANPTTLSDVISAGPENVTFAYEWDVVLTAAGQAGSSFQISKILSVPEPSASALVSLGLVTVALLRRPRRVA
jgi:hypothetical protein